MAAARKKMAEFMREKNHEQGDGERQSSEQCGRVPVGKRKRTDQTFQGNRLILRVGDRELRSSYKTSEKRKQK